MVTFEVWSNELEEAAVIATQEDGIVIFCRKVSANTANLLIANGAAHNRDDLAEFENIG
jgi:hypothetical protein